MYFLDIISLNGETSTSSYYCVSLLILLLTEKLRLLSFFYPNNLLNSFLFDKFPDVYSRVGSIHFFLIFKFKFKFIDFKKTKFKFKFIDFEKSKFKFKFIDFAKVEFKFKFINNS